MVAESWDSLVLHLDSNRRAYTKPLTARQWCAINGWSELELRQMLCDLERMGLVTAEGAIIHGE